MATQLRKMVTYFDEILHINSRDKSRGKLKSLYCHYHSAYCNHKWQGGNLPE